MWGGSKTRFSFCWDCAVDQSRRGRDATPYLLVFYFNRKEGCDLQQWTTEAKWNRTNGVELDDFLVDGSAKVGIQSIRTGWDCYSNLDLMGDGLCWRCACMPSKRKSRRGGCSHRKAVITYDHLQQCEYGSFGRCICLWRSRVYLLFANLPIYIYLIRCETLWSTGNGFVLWWAYMVVGFGRHNNQLF